MGGLDWLSPVVIMLGTFALYFGGRRILGSAFDVPLFWGGSQRSEKFALALVATFAIAFVLAVALSPSHRRLVVRSTERGSVGLSAARILLLIYLAIGAGALALLVQRLGGLRNVLSVQAAWASQIKEQGLGPLYSLTYLYVIGCVVGAFRALLQRRRFVAILWFVAASIPAIILGRRVIILFTALPLLTVTHYHVKRLRLSHIAWLVAFGTVVFTGILLLRLNVRGTVAEAVATSNEFAIYDAMVAVVDRHRELEHFDTGYFLRHPADFWGSNAGALFMQRLVGFQFSGGATPPSAIGVLFVYFGVAGVILGALLLGTILSRLRLEALTDPVAALVYGLVLFYWFDFLRNGDVVLGIKLVLRYGSVLLLLLFAFYRVEITVQARSAKARGVGL